MRRPAVPPGIRRQIDILRRRDFALIWWGGLVSRTGDGFTFFAIAWLFAERGDPTGLAVSLVAYEVAAIAGGIALAGVMDRVSRRRIMVLDCLVRAAAVATIPFVGIWQEPGLLTIALAMAMLGAWSPTADVGLRALTVDLVETHELNAANALEGVQMTAGWMIGPLLGGLCVATLGTLSAFWVDAATFLVFAVALMAASAVTDRIPDRSEPARFFSDLREGFDYVRREPVMLVIVQLTSGANLASGMTMIALPFLVIDQGGGPGTLAVIETITGAGALLGSVMAGAVTWRWPATLTLTWSSVLLSIPIGLIALRPPLWLVAALTALSALFVAPWNVLLLTLRQRVAPPELLGRVLSLTMIVNRAGEPAGQSIGGPLVATVGPAATYAVAGIGGAINGLASLAVARWRSFPLRLDDADPMSDTPGGDPRSSESAGR